MNLKHVIFETINELPENPNYSRKFADLNYDYDGTKMPIELVLLEYNENAEYDKGFAIDILQGSKKYEGDAFETLEEALADAEYRIEDLYEAGVLEAKEYMYSDYDI